MDTTFVKPSRRAAERAGERRRASTECRAARSSSPGARKCGRKEALVHPPFRLEVRGLSLVWSGSPLQRRHMEPSGPAALDIEVVAPHPAERRTSADDPFRALRAPAALLVALLRRFGELESQRARWLDACGSGPSRASSSRAARGATMLVRRPRRGRAAGCSPNPPSSSTSSRTA